MTLEQKLELMKIERKCIEMSNICDRNCSKCPIVQDEKELIDCYNFVIEVLNGYLVRQI